MGNFNSCFRDLKKYCKKPSASHAWIALHRCVESYSRTTGENFNSIFKRIEQEFNIDRVIRDKWPTLSQMHLIGIKLKKEREEYLLLMNQLIKERRLEKKNGKRNSTNSNFINLTRKQAHLLNPKRKFWYWRDKRNNDMKIKNASEDQ